MYPGKRSCSIATPQPDLASTHASTVIGSATQNRALVRFEGQSLGISRQEFNLIGIAEHGYQGGIAVQQSAFGRAEVDALLQSFKELRKSAFLLALLGNIARQNTGAHHLVTLDDGVENAIEVKNA